MLEQARRDTHDKRDTLVITRATRHDTTRNTHRTYRVVTYLVEFWLYSTAMNTQGV